MGTATIHNIRAGCICRAYGFNCLPIEGEIVTIWEDIDGLYFNCTAGKYMIDGQLDADSDEFIGLDLIQKE